MASVTSLKRLVEQFYENFEPVNCTYISYKEKRNGWKILDEIGYSIRLL